MWKNIFIESSLLSALIFAGFYLNATILKDDLYSDNKSSSYLNHISGDGVPIELPNHISGQESKDGSSSHISGFASPSMSRQ
jgi:hypothetical protein